MIHSPCSTAKLVLAFCLTFACNSPTFAQGEHSASQPNLAREKDWPPPVMDHERYSLFLAELLEYRSHENENSIDWDLIGWWGGDKHRLWFKSEGENDTGSSSVGETDFQLLYGQMISAYFDALLGARYEQRWGEGEDASRVSAVLGLEGLSLYMFEIEASLFFADSGNISGRFTASQDYLFTQRTILQLRFETNAATKDSKEFETQAGAKDLSLGARVRYEIRREFAPYIGVSWVRLLGETADVARASGGEASAITAVAGIRAWF